MTGRNGVGKTTVLEAARIWAARGAAESIGDILSDREEVISTNDGQIEQNDNLFIKNLFWGRDPKKSDQIVIGPKFRDDSELLTLTYVDPQLLTDLDARTIESVRKLSSFQRVTIARKFGKIKELIIWTSNSLKGTSIELEEPDPDEFVEEVQFNWLDPELSGTRTVVGFWTKFALTPTEARAVDALNVVTNEKIERIAVVGQRHAQKIIVKVEHADTPVPLRSLGDGATRLLVVASAISCSQGGFLFIDEAEIGIHYSAQASFWKMVLQAAYDNDVQVIATTHSFDCIKGFAEAAVENETVEGILVRIEGNDNALKAVTFDESELEVVARKKIEVR